MNLPSLPDNLHKAVFAIGLLCIGLAYYEYDRSYNKSDKERKHVEEMLTETFFQEKRVRHMEYDFELLCFKTEVRFCIDSLYEKSETGELTYYGIMDGSEDVMLASDSLENFWKDIRTERDKVDSLQYVEDLAKDEYFYNLDLFKTRSDITLYFGLFGLFLSLIGVRRWWKIQSIQDEIIRSGLPSTKTEPNFCQSCARNFSFNVDYGSKSDKSKSDIFCSDCMKNGEFTDYMTIEKLNELKRVELAKCTNRKERKNLQERFEKLKRWNLNEYS